MYSVARKYFFLLIWSPLARKFVTATVCCRDHCLFWDPYKTHHCWWTLPQPGRPDPQHQRYGSLISHINAFL